jgi:hypothetical protein
MGLFPFGKRAKREAPNYPVNVVLTDPKTPVLRVEPERLTPEELRKELFDAAATKDEERLTCLCQTHEKSIFEHGLIWSRVPKEIRSNPVLLRWYGKGLKAIAIYCADRLGKPDLLEQLRKLESQSARRKRAAAKAENEGEAKPAEGQANRDAESATE